MKLSVVLVLCVALWSATLAVAAAGRVPRDAQGVEEASQSVEEILAGGLDEDGDEKDNVDIFHNVTRKEFAEYPDEDEDNYYEEEEEDEDEDVEAPYKKLGKWIKGWPQHPLYIIIVGGYRWDLLGDKHVNLTSFAYLMEHGTTISHLRPVFPTEDYPVWTSMATGLHPEDHGITGDVMYDLPAKTFFNRSDIESTRIAKWWKKAEPFWSTAAKHGKKVASFNWHDCHLPGATLEKPSDCRPYEKIGSGIPSRQVIASLFDEAFTKIHREDYDISIVYTDLVRRAAEIHGIDSPQVYKALHDLDDILQAKLTDIESKKRIRDLKMNVMVISDYGISDTSELYDIVLEDYMDMSQIQNIVYSSGYAAITPYALKHEDILWACRQMEGADVYLTKQVQSPRIWHGVEVPEELHYKEGNEVPDILLVAKPAYQLVSYEEGDNIIRLNELSDTILKAGAGFNPVPAEARWPKMVKGQKLTKELNESIKSHNEWKKHRFDMDTQAFFIGPDFKRRHVVEEPVEVIDLYQLICFLLDIPANDHQGEWDRIEGFLTIASSATTEVSNIIMISIATICPLLMLS